MVVHFFVHSDFRNTFWDVAISLLGSHIESGLRRDLGVRVAAYSSSSLLSHSRWGIFASLFSVECAVCAIPTMAKETLELKKCEDGYHDLPFSFHFP